MPTDRSRPTPAGPLDRLFGIDARSLAAFRIGLGLVILWDVLGRVRTLREHYTGLGMYPRELAAEMRPDAPYFHLFLLSDSPAVQGTLFGLFALLAVLLVLGWRTRLVSVLVFVMLGSVLRRNSWVCHTGDSWLLTLCFWAMFLPLGTALSLDRLRGRAQGPEAGVVRSSATAATLLQVALFYVMAGYLKSRYEIWTRGDAVWVFTHVLEYTRPFGAWLGRFPGVCRFLTHATLVLEGLVPFLLFVPFGTARVRAVLVVVFACFHLTLQSLIHIGVFQLTCIVAMTLFLPGPLWDAVAARLPRALVALGAAIQGRLGRATRVREPGPWAAGLGRARDVLVGLVGVVIVVSNVNAATGDPYDAERPGPLPLPAWIDDLGRSTGLVQNWNMFTDIERSFFGWFLVVGQDEEGHIVDVLARGPLGELRRPEHYARFFPNHNSRRYWREMALPQHRFLQKAMCDYLARAWADEGRTPLVHLAIFHVGQIPLRRSDQDQVKRICDQWEPPHEPLRSVPPEVRQHWEDLRASWGAFLKTLPKTVPADG